MSPEPQPQADVGPQLWWGSPHLELRWHAEALRLFVDPVFHGKGVPRGDGRPVILLPGFGAGDYTLQPLAQWLRRIGYDASTCGMWVNAGCAERAMLRVERRAEELHSGTAAGSR